MTCGGAFTRGGGGNGGATGGAWKGIAWARVAVEATETTEHEELDANPAGGPLWWRFGSARGAIEATEHEEPGVEATEIPWGDNFAGGALRRIAGPPTGRSSCGGCAGLALGIEAAWL